MQGVQHPLVLPTGFVQGGCRLVLDFSPPALLWPHKEPRDRGDPSSGCQQGHLLTEFISIPGRGGDLPPSIRDSETSGGCVRTCAGSTGAQLWTEATSTTTPPTAAPARCPPADEAAAQAGCCWRPPPWPPSSSASVSHRLPPGCAPRALPSAAVARLGELWPARSRLHIRARRLLNLAKLRKEIVPAFKAGAAAEQPPSSLHVLLPVL